MAVTARIRCFFYERRPPLTLHFRPLFTPTHKPLNPLPPRWHCTLALGKAGHRRAKLYLRHCRRKHKIQGSLPPADSYNSKLIEISLGERNSTRVPYAEYKTLPSFGPRPPRTLRHTQWTLRQYQTECLRFFSRNAFQAPFFERSLAFYRHSGTNSRISAWSRACSFRGGRCVPSYCSERCKKKFQRFEDKQQLPNAII